MRRAGACRRGLSRAPHPPGLPRRRLRADGRPGRGEEARRQIAGAGARWCASSRPARSPRTRCSTRGGTITSRRSPMPRANSPSPGSISRPAISRRRQCPPHRSVRRWRGSRRASCCCPSGCSRKPELFELFRRHKDHLTPLPSARFDSENGRKRLEALYGVRELGGFGAFARAEVAAAGALVDYVELTQQGKLPRARRAAAFRRRRRDGDRCGDAAQSRTDRDPDRRAQRQPARRDRPHRDRRRRAAARRSSRRAADRSGANRGAARRRRFLRRRRAVARGAARRAAAVRRYGARDGAAGLGRGGPRDLAALRDTLRVSAGYARSCARNLQGRISPRRRRSSRRSSAISASTLRWSTG